MKLGYFFSAVILAVLIPPQPDWALAWEPSGKVEFIAPATAGDDWDTLCKTTLRVLEKNGLLRLPATVTNMPGANGSTAIAHVAEKRKKDPNVLTAASEVLTFGMAMKTTSFTYADVTPLAMVAAKYGGYVVRTESPFKTFADLVRTMKSTPTGVTFAGGSAPGSLDHAGVALLAKSLGLRPMQAVYLPLRDSKEAVTVLLGGLTDAAVLEISEAKEHLEAGKLRILAVMSENRLKSFPEIPTAREQGVDLVFPRWRGLYMAADVPAEAVEYWSTTIRKMAGTPQWNDELTKLGWEPVTRFGEEFSRYLNSELQLYREVFKELGFIR